MCSNAGKHVSRGGCVEVDISLVNSVHSGEQAASEQHSNFLVISVTNSRDSEIDECTPAGSSSAGSVGVFNERLEAAFSPFKSSLASASKGARMLL